MRTIAIACSMMLAGAMPALAQGHRVYAAAIGGLDAGARGPVASSGIPTIGGTVGLRFSDGWSIEGEIGRGFHSRERFDEGLWLSRVGSGATREEIEQNGVYARFDRTERARLGWAVSAVWKSREPGRLNAALFAGIGSGRFTMRTVRTVTALGPAVDPSPTNPDLQPGDTTRTIAGGGPTGGVRVLFRISPTLTLGPELRCTVGVINDRIYSVVRVGGRLTWGF
jgi:hypothetical protein